jgi:hypothetical protein
MLRFASNRWLAFFLALGISIASVLPVSIAQAHEGQLGAGDDNPLGGGGTGAGDPDQPYGHSGRAVTRGTMVNPRMARAAGDSVAPGSSVGMWRLVVVWTEFRSVWFRF